MGIQLLGIVCIVAWDVCSCLVILLPLKLLKKYANIDLLRVSRDHELKGIDSIDHIDVMY